MIDQAYMPMDGVTELELKAVVRLAYALEVPGFLKRLLKTVEMKDGANRRKTIKRYVKRINSAMSVILTDVDPTESNGDPDGVDLDVFVEAVVLLQDELNEVAIVVNEHASSFLSLEDRGVIHGLTRLLSPAIVAMIDIKVQYAKFSGVSQASKKAEAPEAPEAP